MGVVTRLLGMERRMLDDQMDRLAGIERAGGLASAVTVDTALAYGPLWACVRVISETIASLPCLTYRRLANGGKERAYDTRLYDMLHRAPNPEMTAVEYWETVLAHVLTNGNHYSQIERNDHGAVALWPLEPARMRQVRTGTGQRVWEYRLQNGQLVEFDWADIFHVHGLSWNGVHGLSPIGYARETIATGMAMDDFARSLFENGARPGGVLQHPGRLSEDAYKRVQTGWDTRFGGVRNAYKTAILEEGMEWKPFSIPPEDAQFLESREWQAEEIARWYRVPPHKIGLMKHATFSNIEHQAIEFVTDTLRPWCVRVEQALWRDVIQLGDGKRSLYAEFQIDGLLRGDSVTRARALATQRQNGIISANEWRALENLNPIPGGDVYLVNSALMEPEDIESGMVETDGGED